MSVMSDAMKWSGPSGTRAMLKVIGTLHRLLYRCSSGRIGGTLRGGPVPAAHHDGAQDGTRADVAALLPPRPWR